ncbi:flagellar basal body rod protein FlgF [Vibrio lamellibrachiae]|uniref:flagellar basal body rod protein FlgF n=1 Tax=Vibrio lamellibrachiae TaxID=2910253 RepID=UPI003D0BCE98
MDRMIYTAASGAGRVFTAQQVAANNLANINTHGFRADMERAEAFAVKGAAYDTRALVKAETSGTRFDTAALQQTDRPLDLALRTEGFFAVQMEDGDEAYTRAGNVERSQDGDLTINGLPLIGNDGQQINVPLYTSIEFGDNGTINIVPEGEILAIEVGQVKLVNPETADLRKLENGLFRGQDPFAPALEGEVAMVSGFLEQSNVVAVEEMVSSMNLSRNFEMQLKMMQTAEKIAEAGNRLLRA